MRLALSLAAVGCCLAITARTHAADAPAAEAPPPERKGLVPLLGASIGTVDATRRLGFSFDLAIDALVRKRFGKVGILTGLRPHYERYALGRTDDRSCVYEPSPACGGNTFVYQSSTTANALSLELPLMLEYYASASWTPFVGVSGSALWLNAKERARPAVPEAREAVETSGSKTFAMFAMFVGVQARIGTAGAVIARAGFRFAGYADLPGGSASPRGEMLSIGYVHEL
jgi:hypothetical protein